MVTIYIERKRSVKSLRLRTRGVLSDTEQLPHAGFVPSARVDRAWKRVRQNLLFAVEVQFERRAPGNRFAVQLSHRYGYNLSLRAVAERKRAFGGLL